MSRKTVHNCRQQSQRQHLKHGKNTETQKIYILSSCIVCLLNFFVLECGFMFTTDIGYDNIRSPTHDAACLTLSRNRKQNTGLLSWSLTQCSVKDVFHCVSLSLSLVNEYRCSSRAWLIHEKQFLCDMFTSVRVKLQLPKLNKFLYL